MGKRVQDLPELLSANIASDDYLAVVDTSEDILKKATFNGISSAIKVLETPLEIDGQTVTSIEPALSALNTSKITKSTPAISNNSPYLFKKSGSVGLERLKDIVGGSYVNNQLVQNGNFANGDNWTVRNNSVIVIGGNVATVTPNSANTINLIQVVVNNRIDHKILVSADVKSSSKIRITMQNNNVRFSKESLQSGNWERIQGIYRSREANETLCFSNTTDTSAYDIKNVIVIDLTQLFGSSDIADYIYSLETATAGAGIAKLKELGFDFSAYRAYDAGSIVSVNTSGLKCVGKNLYNKADTSLEYNYYIDGNGKLASWNVAKTIIIPCFPNTQYTISKVSSTRFACGYLTEAIEVGARVYGIVTDNTATSITVTTTENAKYLVAFVYNANADTLTFDAIKNSLQIEFGSTATPYEPYTSKTTPLSPIDLRGLYKIDANNNIYAYGDEYKPSGDVSRKYGIVDLGSLEWTYNSEYKYFYAQLAGRKQVLNSCIAEIYNTIDSSLDGNVDNMRIKLPANSERVFITNNAYTDAVSFTTAISGVYLVYELATPTAETAKPFPEYINIYQGGTEEFIDTRALSAPVGHDSGLFEVNAESIIGTGAIKDGQGNVLSNKQDKFLSEPITVESTEYLTVETALNAINNKSGGGGTQIQSDWNESDDTQVDYIKNKPTLGTASAKDVASSGDASSTEVVMGNDSRLSDARTPVAHNQASSTITAMTNYSKPSSTSAIATTDSLNTAIGKLEKALDGKGTSNLTIGTTSTTAAAGNHTHNYAGSSSAGGAATSATKLTNTSAIGSATNPVYFTDGGVPSACTYSLNKTVPSDAVFTDTKVTSAANHYAPATASGSDVTASATGGTAAWSIDVVQGVTLNTDGKGHVTGMSVTSGKIPANPNTDTKVRQTLSTTNKNYPVLLSAAESSSTTANVDNVSYRANAIYANPSTGNLQVTQLNGVTVGSAPKFTDTTYTATTTSIGSATAGTAIAADDITAWSAGTVPTLGTAIPADDITAWTTNTPTSASVAEGTLTITAGSAASLSYTAKSIPNVTSVGTAPSLTYTARSIPNISVTSTTVATGITTS